MKLPAQVFTAAPPIPLRASRYLEAFRCINRLLSARRQLTTTALPSPSRPEQPRIPQRLLQSNHQHHHQRRKSTPLTRPVPRRTMATKGAVDADLIEAAKRAACQQAVKDNFSPSFKYVGIGSGSTVAYVVEAIAALGPAVSAGMKFVPTGAGSTRLIRDAGLAVLQVPELLAEVGFAGRPGASRQHLDIYFDGADEVDAELNCIKGGGACLFQEKVVSRLSKKFICVADSRKKADRLLSKWAYVPVEVSPIAAELVRQALIDLGSKDPVVRLAASTSTYLITDNHNYLIDAPFPTLLLNSQAELIDPANGLWTPDVLAAKIRGILGVLEVGIFSGLTGPQATAVGPDVEGVKPVKIYFGRADGGFETQE
ncbi:ribose 5-phosphate isomerase A-domain-containing protein [Nemania diffusa]|nr:ribose 5-phosphate isomerase A-domain-containing protein [Nemania diffusa]